MKRIESRDPGVLVYRGRPGGSVVIGVIVLAWGVVAIWPSVQHVADGQAEVVDTALGIFALPFFVIGCLGILGRDGLRIDVASRTYAFRRGPTALSLIALALATFALLFVLAACLGAVRAEGLDNSEWLAHLATAGMLGGVGAVLFFLPQVWSTGRDRLGPAARWQRRRHPLRRVTGSLDAFDKVIVRTEPRVKGYCAILESQTDCLCFVDGRTDQLVVAEAERLAKDLGLPLHDHTTTPTRVRQPDQLDETLRERHHRLGGHELALPDPPKQCKTRHHVEGDTIIFRIPPPNIALAAILSGCATVFAGTPMLIVAVIVPIPAVRIAILSFLGLGCVCVFVVLATNRGTRVEVSPAGLRVAHLRPLWHKEGFIPSAELEELAIAKPVPGMGSAPIVARSDRIQLSFGGSLYFPEKEWIKAVIERVVTGSGRPAIDL